jgi:hypothetical protein
VSLHPVRESLLQAAPRPRWLTHGSIRLGVLCLFIVAVGMIRWRLSTHSAGVLVITAGGAVLAAMVGFSFLARHLVARLPLLDRSQRLTETIMAGVRRIGLPLLALGFFLFWTLVYIALWAFHPGSSFRGLETAPRFADFFYYAVSTAFAAPPGDIVARSRGARSATMIEMLTGFALLATYLAALAGSLRASPPTSSADPDRD